MKKFCVVVESQESDDNLMDYVHIWCYNLKFDVCLSAL